MKRRGKEKIPAQVNNELGLLLFFLVLALLSQLGNRFFLKDFEASADQFAQVIINNQSYLLDLKKTPNLEQLASNCPEGTLQELDTVRISGKKCELVSKGASNWVRLATGKKMLINQASALELEFLPGIGLKRAQELLRLRQELNGFKDFDQLRKLPWVKTQTLEELQRYFTIKDL